MPSPEGGEGEVIVLGGEVVEAGADFGLAVGGEDAEGLDGEGLPVAGDEGVGGFGVADHVVVAEAAGGAAEDVAACGLGVGAEVLPVAEDVADVVAEGGAVEGVDGGLDVGGGGGGGDGLDLGEGEEDFAAEVGEAGVDGGVLGEFEFGGEVAPVFGGEAEFIEGVACRRS